ncbi:transcriptional regulator [Staphylococcus simulans]|uniref:transcriptional regulator n=1 Tax=Staphylococcus simulans TaxID=1286 RepID=UPI003F7D76D9
MKLGKTDVPKLEEYWENISELRTQLNYRKYELLYSPEDTNIGGGKNNLPGNPVQKEVIKLNDDHKYRNLKNTINAIDEVYTHATHEQKLIIQYRYWEKDLLIYEWEDIAHELSKQRKDDKVMSKQSVLRMRNQIMRETADRIGWINFE